MTSGSAERDAIGLAAIVGALISLREARGISRAAMGVLLGADEQWVVKFESAPQHVLASDLQRYVRALGGRLFLALDAPEEDAVDLAGGGVSASGDMGAP